MESERPTSSAPTTSGAPVGDTSARIYSAMDLDALPDVGRELLTDSPLPIVRGTRVVVHAREGQGKSMLVFALCVAIALGGRRVAIFDGEGGAVATRDRLRGICASMHRALAELGDRLSCVVGCSTLDSEDGARALDTVVTTVRPDIVVVDTLANFFAGDENRANEVGAYLRALNALISAGITVVIIAHDRKVSQGTTRDVRGSGAIRAWADSVYGVFTRGGVTVVAHEKERDGPKAAEREMRLTFEPGRIDVWLSEPGAATPKSGEREQPAKARLDEKIVAALARGPSTATKLRPKLGQAGGLIGRALRGLKDRGLVTTRVRESTDSRGRKHRKTEYLLVRSTTKAT